MGRRRWIMDSRELADGLDRFFYSSTPKRTKIPMTALFFLRSTSAGELNTRLRASFFTVNMGVVWTVLMNETCVSIGALGNVLAQRGAHYVTHTRSEFVRLTLHHHPQCNLQRPNRLVFKYARIVDCCIILKTSRTCNYCIEWWVGQTRP
ncbi:hypothetical protein BD410DRAFT_107623 [Rickenella mellea]|uniref:Uncharacterized protein n=1 Tax=Rickenella mellea TaxID=50990 RepID=A0A4Y7PJR3_9AGAM|nr:hypothetical protein BD410DRAFT_107623 [Rickenella mellea]